jgi:hypothetical protein
MRVLRLITVAVLAYAVSLSAQGNPISDALRGGWNTAKRNMLGSAKVMPEAKYGFKPVDTVRTYGQILAHVAGANYEFCSAAKGEKTPFTEDGQHESQQRALRQSRDLSAHQRPGAALLGAVTLGA